MELERKIERCSQYYRELYQQSLVGMTASEAVDTCFHAFLDQKPSIKGLSSRGRATALLNAGFWREFQALRESKWAAVTLSRVLWHDEPAFTECVTTLAVETPELLRWAIRHAKLFTRAQSPLWQQVCDQMGSDPEWGVFIGVCNRLLAQLQPFDAIIETVDARLSGLSLLELLGYLSVLAYEHLREVDQGERAGQRWAVYHRIIQRKLISCAEDGFNLSEARLAASLGQHLAPLLFPAPDNLGERFQCERFCEDLRALIAATQERLDYEGSIDWFCFDPECRYQLVPGEPVLFNETTAGSERWRLTQRKADALWAYWMYRGTEAFVQRGLAEEQIGRAENHARNQLAYVKALRSLCQLQEVYGLDDQVTAPDGTVVPLLQLLLASELTSAFFESEYLAPFRAHYQASGSVLQALGRLAFDGMRTGENRLPMTWSGEGENARRIVGWTVCAQYPTGSERVASGIVDFWTTELKTLARQLTAEVEPPTPRLYEMPFYKLGRFSFQFPWIVAQQNNLTAAVNTLRRVRGRRPEVNDETRRVELRLAEQLRQRGFAVVVGYQPARSDEGDAGEVDLIGYRDGRFLVIELKSGYIRSTPHEIWLHRTSTLRKAALQICRKRAAVVAALAVDAGLRGQLGCPREVPEAQIHTWIVDTSIELDQQRVDGCLVVSLEALLVALRDEAHLLTLTPDGAAKHSLYPDGFEAQCFIDIVESGRVWAGI
ncbi:NERD domain-containing protein [Pseudomonas sp. D(2018)]|uniref:NERD domain-containing protein n=1 Tax=Pseudomonas sp. D(2018) TaxID=2502238 RepID=UPI002114E63C|nr:NERD domain-containing protein [Pseudomonas sp. D(2018)]